MSDSQGERQKRPEFVNDIRVKAPEDYDFNTWGNSQLTQARISQNTIKISGWEPMQFGRKPSSKTGSASTVA